MMRTALRSIALSLLLLARPGWGRAEAFILLSIERDNAVVIVVLETDVQPLVERFKKEAPDALRNAVHAKLGKGLDTSPVLRSVDLRATSDAKSFSVLTKWQLQITTRVGVGRWGVNLSKTLEVGLDGRVVCDILPGNRGRARILLDHMSIEGNTIDIRDLRIEAGQWVTPLNPKGDLADIKVLDFRIKEVQGTLLTVEASLDGAEPPPP